MTMRRLVAGDVEFPCGARYANTNARDVARMMDNGRVQLLVFQAEGDPRTHRRPVRPDGVEVSCLDACPTPEHRELIDGYTEERGFHRSMALCGCRVVEPTADLAIALADELDALRLAVKAFAGAAPDVFGRVTHAALRAELERRDWFFVCNQPWPGEPQRIAFARFEHDVKQSKSGKRRVVRVPLVENSPDWLERVADCITAASERLGTAPAEMLASVLMRLNVPATPTVESA